METHDKDVSHAARRNILVDQISKVVAGGFVKIHAGEMNCFVYDHPDVDAAVRQAHSRGATISILAGPALSIRKKGQKVNVESWAEERIVTLFCKTNRLDNEHFRLIKGFINPDTVEVYAELPHKPLDRGERIDLSDYEDKLFWFNKNNEHFDFYVHSLSPSLRPSEDFLLLVPEDIDRAVSLADEKLGKDSFNYLTKEEIYNLLN